MSDWFTSKLKAAETILQKIDKQAAESLGKNETPRSDDGNVGAATKSSGNVSLKDQLKKKSQESYDHAVRLSTNSNNSRVGNNEGNNGITSTSSSPGRKSAVIDGDWTELLGTSNEITSPSMANRSNGTSGTQAGKSNSRRPGSLSLNTLVPELKRNQKTNSSKVPRSSLRSSNSRDTKVNGKQVGGEDSLFSSSAAISLKADSDSHEKILEHQASDKEDIRRRLMQQVVDEENMEDGWQLSLKQQAHEFSEPVVNNGSADILLTRGSAKALPKSMEAADGSDYGLKGSERGDKVNVVLEQNVDKKAPLESDVGSASETESGSTSNSDSENERRMREERSRRREKLLAEKTAAKAVEAIRERENRIARLEGEKQSLEKIIEERAKQQAEEASELQNIMIETMEAVEQEKQKHNNTRMEALTRLAILETANAELAKSLAAAQRHLEIEVKLVNELREQIELKEVAHEGIRRRISSTHQTGTSLKQLAAARGVEVERELLDAECSFISDELVKLQEKAKSLEENIGLTRKEMEEPTEVEIELKRRLGQLTDHLIQKQAQVEALSSEKATLAFRIEAVSRLMEESNSGMNANDFSSVSLRDVESGMWDPFDSKPRHSLEDKIRSGREHIGSLVRQLDAIFLAGAVFLKRNPTAKIWAIVYLVCLHLWVLYILTSHSGPSDKPGAVFSLENLSNSSNI